MDVVNYEEVENKLIEIQDQKNLFMQLKWLKPQKKVFQIVLYAR